jgi:hypothetical protein
MKEMREENLRDLVITTGSGKDVEDTDMLKGEAKDSLSGKNVLKQHMVEAPPTKDIGGEAKY